MSFLQAEWRKLALANYVIDPEILKDLVPAKTELDLWDGKCYVSLVGFKFVNTRLLGIPIPFHTHFEEVNLRFYVKHFDGDQWKRGVVFVKEIVPKPMLTFVANTVYKEHYQTLPMRYLWEEDKAGRKIVYEWKSEGEWQKFETIAEYAPSEIGANSEAEFITEHYWGYTKVNARKSFEYQVTHPRWEQYKVKSHKIDVDFGKVYGERFSFINQLEPVSVMLAEGSEITVEGKKSL
ncbi:MAG: DUF2071 domain-containing protein [Bacteroidia bacterium]|nr:DUF2071 domain-containing protein [Bacteroidia bacterium]